jgi:hypothetical protein
LILQSFSKATTMTAVTLQQIEARQSELLALIAQFKAQPAAQSTRVQIRAADIELAHGEHYAGLVLAADGTPSHHLVLLPGDHDDANWDDATTWAREQDGFLPTRQEQALLYANCKAQFQAIWYWSGELHADNSSFAWGQNFDDGYQYGNRKDYTCRARAVRRFAA